MLKTYQGMSISRAIRFLYSKGLYYYNLKFAYRWNTGYNIFHWGF